MISLHTRGLNGILADEMGLGKTLQSIALLAYLTLHAKVPRPHVPCSPRTLPYSGLSLPANWNPRRPNRCPCVHLHCTGRSRTCLAH